MNRKLLIALLITLCTNRFNINAAQAYQSDAEKIQKHLEAIKSRGEPTTRQEVDENRNALKPGVEDVTTIWLEGMKSMQRMEFFEREPPIPPYFNLLKAKKPPLPSEEWPDLPEVERFLAEFEPSIKKFHEAARRGGYGRVNHLSSWDEKPSPSLNLFGNINASRFLAIDAVVQSRKGQTARCASSLLAALKLSRALQNHPGVIASVSAHAADNSAAIALASLLCNSSFTEAEVNDFRSVLTSIDWREQTNLTYLEHRVIQYESLRNPWIRGFTKPAPTPAEADWILFFEISEQIIENASKPFPECLQSAESLLREIEARIKNAEPSSESTVWVLKALRTYTLPFWLQNSATRAVSLQSAITGIAVELYRREHGQLPPTLDVLIPKYLPAVPTDPFSGKPMVYKLEESGFTIYSVGKNKTDEGGKLDSDGADVGLFFPTKTK